MRPPENEVAAPAGAAALEGQRETGTLVSLAAARARVKGNSISIQSLLALTLRAEREVQPVGARPTSHVRVPARPRSRR